MPKLSEQLEISSGVEWMRLLEKLTFEYTGLVVQIDNQDNNDLDRIYEIERDIYTIYEALGEQQRSATTTIFRVFIAIKYQYRILPTEQKPIH